MDRIRHIEIFVAAAERLSFSGAARALNVSPAAVSSAVAALETTWRVRLFDRNTRTVRLTPVGQGLLERSRRILREWDLADAAASAESGELRGLIKVSAPMSFGTKVLAPVVASFLEANPAIDLELDLADRRVDLLAEGYDLAVRVGHQIAPGLVARKLANQTLQLCAAPSYISRNRAPQTPADLTQHNCLVFTPRLPTGRWTFTRAGERRVVTVAGGLKSDNGEVLQLAARSGLGVTLAPDFLVADDLASGALIELLPGWSSLPLGVYSVRPGGGRATTRIARLIDHLRRSLTMGPAEGGPAS